VAQFSDLCPLLLRAGFAVHTAMAPNSTTFRGVVTCSTVEVYRRFGRTYCHHLKNPQLCMVSAWLTLRSLRWRRYVPQERESRSSTFTLVHVVTPEDTVRHMSRIRNRMSCLGLYAVPLLSRLLLEYK
jgi:hypothetical protein